jgi:hypothetical protein
VTNGEPGSISSINGEGKGYGVEIADESSDVEMEIIDRPQLTFVDEACGKEFTFCAAVFHEDSPTDSGSAKRPEGHPNGPAPELSPEGKCVWMVSSEEPPSPFVSNTRPNSEVVADTTPFMAGVATPDEDIDDLSDILLKSQATPYAATTTSYEARATSHEASATSYEASVTSYAASNDMFGSLDDDELDTLDAVDGTVGTPNEKAVMKGDGQSGDGKVKKDLRDYWKVETPQERERRQYRDTERHERDCEAQVFQDEQSRMRQRDKVRTDNRERAQRCRDLKRERKIEVGWAPGQKRVSVLILVITLREILTSYAEMLGRI